MTNKRLLRKEMKELIWHKASKNPPKPREFTEEEPERNPIPNVDREQPDFRCKFSIDNPKFPYCKKEQINCEGLAADRKRCPHWNK